MSYDFKELRTLSAFDYLMNYRPQGTLIRKGRNDYIHNVHDSLHFSNGKWYWFSKGFGGTSALDYLEKVEGFSIADAARELNDIMKVSPPTKYFVNQTRKPFVLPMKDYNNNMVISYLSKQRKIDLDIIKFFIDNNMLYQDMKFKNAIFVGFDGNKPAYAFKRSIFSKDRFDHSGSNKAFSFSLNNISSDTLHVFEACIDLLSYLTILKINNEEWLRDNYLSLAGASASISRQNEADIPIALRSYLERNPNIKTIIFHLDNDEVGIKATRQMTAVLRDKYICLDEHPKKYKDVNDELIGEYYGKV